MYCPQVAQLAVDRLFSRICEDTEHHIAYAGCTRRYDGCRRDHRCSRRAGCSRSCPWGGKEGRIMIASVAGRGGANERDLGSVAEFARPELQGLRACVPDWHGVRVKLDSNESPFDLPACIKENALRKLREIPFNRYPQGLAASSGRRLRSATGSARHR